MAVATYTKTGSKATTPTKLDKAVFGLEVKNHDILKEAYVTYLANGRSNYAKTLKRGEVSGGGKKPWKQKGTGRARFGSSRNPIWRGGGIAFGPTGNENYTKNMPVSVKRLALRQALSVAAASGKIIIIEDMVLKTAKTKEGVSLLQKIGATGNVIVVVKSKDEAVERALSNAAKVRLMQATYLNVAAILDADSLVITHDSLDSITDWLGGKAK